LIEVQGLSKYYGEHAAVRDVTFRAERGEILGFLGPNGAGKTTTMRMLTCFLPPTRGSARVAGFDILDQSMEVRRRVGYLPESVPLYRDLTARAYIEYAATLKGMAGAQRPARIDAVMEDCGITEVRHKVIGALSRGYRQRVGIAQALVNDPEVLVLDEPTVGLDPRQIVEIRELIRRLAGERTVILSTHILPEVSLLCGRVIIINKGVLVTDDTPSNLGRNLQGPTTVDLTARGDAASIQSALSSVPGVHSVTVVDTGGDTTRFQVETAHDVDIRDDIAAAIVRGGHGLLGMEARRPSLEDIFVHLVTEEERSDD